jgi:hypothetical protein
MGFWEGVLSVFDLAGHRGLHRKKRVRASWDADLDALRGDWAKIVAATGTLAGAPHRFDHKAKRWTCLGCGQEHPDPCACPCCREVR